MKLRFFVICWGENYADLYERVAIRSLTQPKNLAAIPSDAAVSVYSDAATMERVALASAKLGTVERHILEPRENYYDTQNQAFIDEVRACATAEDTALVIINPDCFWGDGSLANLLQAAGSQNVCVASPHVRVDRAKFLDQLDSYDLVNPFGETLISNSRLVSLAMKTLHQSWIDADLSKPESNSYYTGIGIKQISDDMWAIHHLLPTIFYAKLNASDYGFFAERPNAKGLWDHSWPAVLAGQGRQRTIASSDAVCIVELTDSASHQTPLRAVNPEKPDEYCRTGPHIEANRGVISIWRSC